MTANLPEFARRIKVLGQLITLLGAALPALFFYLRARNEFISYVYVRTLYIQIVPLFVGCVLWSVGWVFQGFARKDASTLKGPTH
jgi:hypothetical protein